MKKKFPSRKGEKNSNKKLSRIQVDLLRLKLEGRPLPRAVAAVVGRCVGVSARQIYRIKANQAWREK